MGRLGADFAEMNAFARQAKNWNGRDWGDGLTFL
jgi:hypothetical protein